MSNKKNVFPVLLRYLTMILGAVIYASGVALFLDPLSLAPGGISGLAIVINKISNIPTGVLYFGFNVPLLIIAWRKFGFKMLSSTILVICTISVTLEVYNFFTGGQPIITENPLLAGVAGGVTIAVGIGTVFRTGATSGGVDIIVKLLRLKFKHINTGTIFFATDMMIIALSAILFQNIEIALYALVAVFVNSKVIDYVLYGTNRGKLVYIISDLEKELVERITHDLDLGATVLKGEGAYTGKEKNMLMCAVKAHSFPKLRKLVKDIDKNAFMIVSDTTQIFGEGYQAIDKEDL